MCTRKFWGDWGGAILFALSSLATLTLGIFTMMSLIAPLNMWVWVVLGLGIIVGLVWQITAPRRELNLLKDVRARAEQLRLYDEIEIRPHRFAWNEHQHAMGVTGFSTLRMGLRLVNTGRATVSTCSLMFAEAGYNEFRYYGDDGRNEWVADPVGTQMQRLRPEDPLPTNPAYAHIAHGGGATIFNLVDRQNPPSMEFHYVFSSGNSARRILDGLYCARLQLEGTVQQDNIEVELAPKQFLAIFRYRNRRFSPVRIFRL